MSKKNTAIKLIKSTPNYFVARVIEYVAFLFPDKLYLRLQYRLIMGKTLDLNHPMLFSEKIQWLKLYNRKSCYTMMVDKFAVKEYVSAIIGKQYVIPTLGVWNDVCDIEWGNLPDKFVLKTTNGGGGSGVVICKDKRRLNIRDVERKLKKSLSQNIYSKSREWPYKNVPRRILAEVYMQDESPVANSDLSDYKFYCCNGEPIYCQVIRDRSTKETIDFYDMDWNHMPFVGLNPIAQNGRIPVERPNSLSTMIDICRKLSENIPFVRIDLYEIGGHPYFGEITFFPNKGLGRFTPNEWDLRLGQLIKLPINIKS